MNVSWRLERGAWEYDAGIQWDITSGGFGLTWSFLGRDAPNGFTLYLGPLSFWVGIAYWSAWE